MVLVALFTRSNTFRRIQKRSDAFRRVKTRSEVFRRVQTSSVIKLFKNRNLQVFVLSWSVRTWQAFPA